VKASPCLAFVIVTGIGKNYNLEREISQNNYLCVPPVGPNLGGIPIN